MSAFTKEHQIVIAIDISGSVTRFNHYWNVVKHVIHLYRSRYAANELVFLQWDNDARVVTYSVVQDLIATQKGYGGTEPHCILETMARLDASSYELCLITDGEVVQNSVNRCDQILQDYRLVQLSRVECHIVNANPNLSVSCPFTRNGECKVTTYRLDPLSSSNHLNGVVQLHLTKDDWTLLRAIETVTLDTFLSKYENLQSILIAKHMGREGDPILKEKFIALKKRLIQEMSERNSTKTDYNQMLTDCLTSRQIPDAIEISKRMLVDFYSASPVTELSRKIDTLIGLCGNLQHQFNPNELKSTAASRVQDAVHETPTTFQVVTDTEYECPILLEQDCPCILIHRLFDSLLVGLEKDTVDFIIDCPLRLLLFPELVQKTKALMGHPVGLKTALELHQKYRDENYYYYQEQRRILFTSPYNREPVMALLALGNHESHFRSANYIVYTLFTSQKQLGNADMWLAVLYLIAKQLDYLTEVMESFQAHLRFRWNYSTTFASLSGNGTLINTKLCVQNALWFVLSCSVIGEDIVPQKQNPFRFHLPNLDSVLCLVDDLIGSHTITEEIKHSILQTKVLMRLLKWIKEHPSNQDLLYQIADALWRPCELVVVKKDVEDESQRPTIQTRVVFVDASRPLLGQVHKVYQLIEQITHQSIQSLETLEVYRLLKSVHRSKSAGDTFFDTSISIPTQENSTSFYWPYLYSVKVPKSTLSDNEILEVSEDMFLHEYIVPICYATFRPYSSYYDTERKTQTTWEQSAFYRCHLQDKATLFPGTKYFLLFIQKYKRVPSEDEYVWFCHKRLTTSSRYGPDTPIPLNLRKIFQWICKDYRPVFARAKEEGVKIAEIVRRIDDSTLLEKRKQLEKTEPYQA